ncbi:hypothetical protein [Amycolatopsis sp. lyj-109]
MLVSQMATNADFDPDVRRRVANILSRATNGDGQRIHLIDVRQEG